VSHEFGLYGLSDTDLVRDSDFKKMAKIVSGILILRNGSSPEWTNDLDAKMNNWTTNYISWIVGSPIAYGEWTADK
jgi:hypothetical protein